MTQNIPSNSITTFSNMSSSSTYTDPTTNSNLTNISNSVYTDNTINMVLDNASTFVNCCTGIDGSADEDNQYQIVGRSANIPYDNCIFPTTLIAKNTITNDSGTTTTTYSGSNAIQADTISNCDVVMKTYCTYQLRDYLRTIPDDNGKTHTYYPYTDSAYSTLLSNITYNKNFNIVQWGQFVECACYPYEPIYEQITKGTNNPPQCIYANCGFQQNSYPYVTATCNETICVQNVQIGPITITGENNAATINPNLKINCSSNTNQGTATNLASSNANLTNSDDTLANTNDTPANSNDTPANTNTNESKSTTFWTTTNILLLSFGLILAIIVFIFIIKWVTKKSNPNNKINNNKINNKKIK
jgi:hypothetical protein